MYERTGKLIREKFREYLLPGILSSMAMSLASAVDGIIVGNLLGDTALAVVGLAGPVILCVNVLYMIFGIGGMTCASIARGKRETEQSNKIFTLTISVGTAVMLAFSVAMQFALPSLSRLLVNGQDALAPMLESYLKPLVFTGPAIMIASGISLFIRIDGKPKSAMAVVLIANAVNLLFDFVLIRFFDTGIWGAGFSTTLGYIVGIAVVIPYLFSKKRTFKFVKCGKGGLRTVGNIITAGLPRGLTQASNLVCNLVLNFLIIGSLGSIGMSTLTVCGNALMIANIFFGGTADALLPIAGTLYGEGDDYGIRQTMKSAAIVIAISCAAMLAFTLSVPQVIGMAFGIHSKEGLAVVEPALRLYSAFFPFTAALTLLQNFYTTTGRKKLATAMVLMSGFIFLIPFAFLFAKTDPDLIWISFACAAATTLLVTVMISIWIRKKEKVRGLLLLRPGKDDIRCDVTISASVQEAAGLSDQIIKWCLEQNFDAQLANKVGIAIEEMAVSTAHYAHHDSGKGSIDVALCVNGELLTVLMRDNGELFNPAEYTAAKDDGCITDGIQLMKTLASKVEYARRLGFNTTILTFDCKKKETAE